MAITPRDSEHVQRGKWSDPGVPHKGWNCVMVDDLEEPSHICEMCETAEIRYVHYMEHPAYSGSLGVGCVCAEHMEEDYVGPKVREKKLKRVARRRKTWRARQWNTSAKGNRYLNTEGFNLALFPKGDGWGFKIEHRSTGRTEFARRTYQTEQDAKDGTLIAVLLGQEELAMRVNGSG